MNASRARYTSSRKKISVTYTLRNEREPLNRSGVNKIRIDPKRKRLLAAGRDSIIRCWDVEGLNKTDGQCDCIMTMEHHTDWVNDMVICKDGSTLMSGSCDTSLKVWDLSRGICTSTLKPHKDYVQALAYSPQTEIVVSAGLDHELYLWDINTLRNLSSTKNTVSTIPLRGQKQSIYAVDINTQGSLIVSGSTEKALRIWDARNYQKIMKLKGHTDNVRSVILNDDGTECLSASSDGTVRLWSIGSQRCIETFRIHEGGVWTLAVDESFRYFYSSGKDKRVYITDMSEGGQESVLLFTEEYPVLSIALDTSADDMDYLWVGTTGTSINKWPATPNQQPTDEEEEEHNGMEQQPVVTDIDEIDTSHERPLLTIPGATTIIDCKTLNNKRHVLTKDNTGNVALWDVLHAVKESELGMVDLDVEAQRRQEDLFIPNWFSCDIKTGLLSIRLEENDCFSAWVMGNNTNIPNTDDLKLNYGALMLKALFEHWPESHLAKQQQTVKEHSADPAEIPVLQEVFLSVMSQLSDPCAIGRALGLKDEEVNELPKGNQLEMYKMIYNKCSQETGLSYNAFQNALISIDHEELASKLEELHMQSKHVPESKVDVVFFSVPRHTPVVLSEATDCGATQVRFICSEACNGHEKTLLKTYCPMWISDIVAQNQLPNHPKMSFTLGKFEESKERKTDRLSAQDILSVRKVIDYLYSKLYGEVKNNGETTIDPTDVLQIYCQGQLLDPSHDIRTVRHMIWKSGGDMKLLYKIIEDTPNNDDNDINNKDEEVTPSSSQQ